MSDDEGQGRRSVLSRVLEAAAAFTRDTGVEPTDARLTAALFAMLLQQEARDPDDTELVVMRGTFLADLTICGAVVSTEVLPHHVVALGCERDDDDKPVRLLRYSLHNAKPYVPPPKGHEAALAERLRARRGRS